MEPHPMIRELPGKKFPRVPLAPPPISKPGPPTFDLRRDIDIRLRDEIKQTAGMNGICSNRHSRLDRHRHIGSNAGTAEMLKSSSPAL